MGSRSKGWPLAAVLAVVAVVLLLLVYLTPNSTPPTPLANPGGPESAIPFSTARSEGDAAAAASEGGPWALVDADGGVNGSLSDLFSPRVNGELFGAPLTGCNLALGSGYSESSEIPTSAGDGPGGLTSSWVLLYTNVSMGILVAVSGNRAATFGEVSGGPDCRSALSALPPLPANAIDSTRVGRTLAAAEAAFVALAPDGLPVYGLHGNRTGDATWNVEFADCAREAEYFAEVNATSGVVASSYLLLGDPCGGPLLWPINASGVSVSDTLTLGPWTWAYPTGTMGSVPVVAALYGVEWDNLSATVLQPTQRDAPVYSVVAGNWTLTALSPAGGTIATYDPAGWSWGPQGTTPITAGDSLELTLTPALATTAPVLELGGLGAYYGNFVF